MKRSDSGVRFGTLACLHLYGDVIYIVHVMHLLRMADTEYTYEGIGTVRDLAYHSSTTSNRNTLLKLLLFSFSIMFLCFT